MLLFGKLFVLNELTLDI